MVRRRRRPRVARSKPSPKVTRENPKVVVDLNRLEASCFVLMPFAPTYQSLYERIIKPAVESTGLKCVRGDEVFSKAQITHDIWNQVRSCRLVLAELSGKNPNVLYELGLAHAIGKPSIIITRSQEDVPFDLRALRYVYYDTDDPFWGDNLGRQIATMIKTVIDRNDFGSVFEAISLRGNRTVIPAQPSQRQRPEAADVAGHWHGVFRYAREESETSWALHLTQDGQNVNGTLIVSTTNNGGLTVVQELVAGEVIGTTVRFHATSYSFLEGGTQFEWYLDEFEGRVVENGAALEGTVRDEALDTGKVVLRRVVGSSQRAVPRSGSASRPSGRGSRPRRR